MGPLIEQQTRVEPSTRRAIPRRVIRGPLRQRPGIWAALLLACAVAALPLSAAPVRTPVEPAQEDVMVPALVRNGFVPDWQWPLAPAPDVLRSFQPPAQRWLPGHRGVDLPALPGTPVLSPAAGTVVFAGWVVNRPVLTVDLGSGLLSSFEPVEPAQQAGDVVAEGEVLGQVAEPAAPGHCPASCLHWGVRLHGDYVNPLNYVTDRRPSVLLPLR